jgi:hypothetical protein
MGTRRFRPEDITAVARLWIKTFGNSQGPAVESVAQYLQDVLFCNPWFDQEIGSLVHEEHGQILGFVGVMARPMKFPGRCIRTAVATQLLVDKSQPSVFVAAALIRKLFAGPQDLTFSDGANDVSRRIFESAGGEVASLYAPVWTRVLRPAEYLARECRNRKVLERCIGLSLPLCRAFDAAAVRIQRSPYRLETANAADTESCDAATLWLLRQHVPERSLSPVYTGDTFAWLLDHASQQELHGVLQKGVVRDIKGEVAGWFLYYVKPGGVAQVLQVSSKPKAAGYVLRHLFHHAWQRGAVAVSGQADPAMTFELGKVLCTFTWSGGVVIHSRNHEILDAIRRGKAELTRLEGEWWMRFCDLAETRIPAAVKQQTPYLRTATVCAE